MGNFFHDGQGSSEQGGAGPRSAAEWRARDPLRGYYQEREAFFSEALYSAWSDFTPEARAAAWREREAAAFLFERQAAWQERLPNLAMVGTAWRPWSQIQFSPGLSAGRKFIPWDDETARHWQAYRETLAADPPDYDRAWQLIKHIAAGDPAHRTLVLAGVLSITPPWETPLEVFLRLDQPPVVDLPSQLLDLDRFGLPPFLPLVVEPVQPFVPYGGQFPAQAPAGLVVQSGIRVENPPGFGTLTAAARQNGQEVLLGPHHIFGGPGNVVEWSQRGRIGQVTQALPDWDAALAALDPGISTSPAVAGLGLVPARPMPPSGLVSGVQFYGAASGAHPSGAYLDQVYVSPGPGLARTIGSKDCFIIKGHAKHGDSGALIVAASTRTLGASGPNPALEPLYQQAMLGMLVAGPLDDSDANMPAAFFCRPVFELALQLNLTF